MAGIIHPTSTPVAEVALDAALVQRLLQAQHPDLADLPIKLADEGWDNAMYRLGDALCVRLPRRQLAVPLIEKEQKWLPRLAGTLPLPMPAPVRVGLPTAEYPWPWSIVPWLAGNAADLDEPHENQAKPFAAFLRSLHVAAPANAPHNEWRGVPLRVRADAVAERMQRLATKTDFITDDLRRIWQDALAAPDSAERCWLHGDLHAQNVLVNNGIITGIIDWGDLTAGDVATDLAAIWGIFATAKAREAVLAEYNVKEDLLRRAKGWAIFFGTILLDTGLVNNPRHAVMGERTLRRVMEF